MNLNVNFSLLRRYRRVKEHLISDKFRSFNSIYYVAIATSLPKIKKLVIGHSVTGIDVTAFKLNMLAGVTEIIFTFGHLL